MKRTDKDNTCRNMNFKFFFGRNLIVITATIFSLLLTSLSCVPSYHRQIRTNESKRNYSNRNVRTETKLFESKRKERNKTKLFESERKERNETELFESERKERNETIRIGSE